MKSLYSILFISLLFICFSNVASSQLYVDNFYAVDYYQYNITGNFNNNFNQLNVSIGYSTCYVTSVSNNTISCYLGVQLTPYYNYIIEVTQDYESLNSYVYLAPYCVNGYYQYYQCYCYSGYIGFNCDKLSPNPVVYYTTTVNSTGGYIYLNGWFTDSPWDLSFIIDNDFSAPINVTYASTYYIQGYAPAATPGYHVLNIVSNSSIIFSYYYVYYEEVSNCLNNCSSNGICYNSTCSCYYGWYGPDCSYYNGGGSSNSGPDSSSSSSSPSEPIITCVNTGKNLRIESYSKINCTGYGQTQCVDNNSGSTCSTDQSTGIIKCTSGSNWYNQQHSLTCNGTHIECKSSYVKCIIDIEGSFHVNDILSTSNIVSVNDKHAQLNHQLNQQLNSIQSSTSSSSSSSLSFNILLLLSITLLFALL